VTILGNVTDSIIAGHDISVEVFLQALERASAALDARDALPDETKRSGLALIQHIRDWMLTASGEVAVATSGGLAAEAIMQALRLHV
jgi:hypothetical protein